MPRFSLPPAIERIALGALKSHSPEELIADPAQLYDLPMTSAPRKQ